MYNLFKAKVDRDADIFKKVKVIEDNDKPGLEKVNEYFVDSSGFGSSSEPALTANAFLAQVKANRYYGITSQGQFQVYISEYEKVNSKDFKRQKIANNTYKLTYNNGDIDIILHCTTIIKVRGQVVSLFTEGYTTPTTKRRFNEYLSQYDISVYQSKGQWYVDTPGAKGIEFVEGMAIEL